jgi:hypothetical protein
MCLYSAAAKSVITKQYSAIKTMLGLAKCKLQYFSGKGDLQAV